MTLQEGRNKDAITLITEGVETGLSLKVAHQQAHIKITLGSSNFLNVPPAQVSHNVVFCLDNDGPQSATQITAHKAMQRLQEAGKTVFYNQPNEIKTNYNDVLKLTGSPAIQSKIASSTLYQPDISASFTLKIEGANLPIAFLNCRDFVYNNTK